MAADTNPVMRHLQLMSCTAAHEFAASVLQLAKLPAEWRFWMVKHPKSSVMTGGCSRSSGRNVASGLELLDPGAPAGKFLVVRFEIGTKNSALA